MLFVVLVSRNVFFIPYDPSFTCFLTIDSLEELTGENEKSTRIGFEQKTHYTLFITHIVSKNECGTIKHFPEGAGRNVIWMGRPGYQ